MTTNAESQPVREDEMSGDLPKGWAFGEFGEITENFDGRRIPVKSDDRKDRRGKYPYYGASGQIDTIDDYIFDGEFLLVAEDGANLLSRSTAIAFSASGKFWVNNHAHIVQPLGHIPLGFLEHYLNRIRLEDYVTGSAQPKLTQAALNRIAVPLAPLEEQDRIIAKIGELLKNVNATRARLAKVLKILKAFRQSVLAAACSGRLTEDWREVHHGVENATELLTRIRVARRCAWEKAELAKIRSRGSFPKSDKWKDKYVEPDTPEASDIPELPETWCCTGIEILLSTSRRGMKTGPFGSSLKKQEHQASGIPVLGIENIGEMKFIEGSKIHISHAKARELAEFDALPDDILISRSGTVGEVCVVPPGLGEARISTNIMRLTLQEGSLLPTYFCYLFNGSPFVLGQTSQLCGGSSRDFLNQRILFSLLLPLPPLEEQHEIVRRVGILFKLAEKIQKRVEAATMRADKLTLAVLAKAFCGELVSTEAEIARSEGRDYEPASKLLERIKAERENGAAKNNGTGHSRRSRK